MLSPSSKSRITPQNADVDDPELQSYEFPVDYSSKYALPEYNALSKQKSLAPKETVKLISKLNINDKRPQMDRSKSDTFKKKILKLNPLKNRFNQFTKKKKNIRYAAQRPRPSSISHSLSQSGSHTPPCTSPIVQTKHSGNLASIEYDIQNLSSSRSESRASSKNQSEMSSVSRNSSQCVSNAISSINSQSDYITPRSNESARSSLSSLEWDSKNMSKWNKNKAKEVLFRCTRHGRYKDVKMMLEKGINPNIVDKHGNTILLVAAQNGSKRLVKTALRYNANMNHQNHRGNTAAHYAFAYGYTLLGEYIMSKGADDRLTNEYGFTCYEGINLKNKLSMSKRKKSNLSAKELIKGKSKSSPKCKEEKTHID